MTRFLQVPEPSIIVPLPSTTEPIPHKALTFTGAIGAACMLPLRGIINLCVALRIHPNTLTLIGVLINVGAAWALGFGRFRLAFVIMLVANIFDFIDGKVAHILGLQSEFGAFWDSTLDRFSDLALLTGLIFLYSKLNRSDYVMIAALDADLLDHDQLRARPRRIAGREVQGRVHGAPGTDRPADDRHDHEPDGGRAVGDAGAVDPGGGGSDLLHLSRAQPLPMPTRQGAAGIFNRAVFWTDERATLPYDLWVIAILAFVWLVPPQWLGDPMAHDAGWSPGSWLEFRIKNLEF